VPSIIYLHGFASGPGSSKAKYFKERLERHGARVMIPDLAGGDFERSTITSQLALVERLAAGRPVVLIGSSLGGYLAALFAARHPEVGRVVLMAPAFGFPRRWPERLGPARLELWRSTGWIEVFHYGEGRSRKLRYRFLEDGSRYEDYPDFRQPALIFHGINDDVVPVRYSEQFAATHPNSQLQVLESGHELHNVMEQMGSGVARFLGLID
jgi:uncharacterized protein